MDFEIFWYLLIYFGDLQQNEVKAVRSEDAER